MSRILTAPLDSLLFWTVTNGSVTIQSTIARTGPNSMQANTIANIILLTHPVHPIAAGVQWFTQFGLYVASTPSENLSLVSLSSSGVSYPVAIGLRTDLGLTLLDGTSTEIGSPSGPISLNTWYYVEMSYNFDDGAISGRVDGVEFASGTTDASISVNLISIGVYDLPNGNGANADLYYDDIIVNNSNGSVDNTWPGGAGVPSVIVSLNSLALPW